MQGERERERERERGGGEISSIKCIFPNIFIPSNTCVGNLYKTRLTQKTHAYTCIRCALLHMLYTRPVLLCVVRSAVRW